MQCKDIPTIPVLEFLQEHGGIGCNWFESFWSDGSKNDRSVRHVMPIGTPDKLVLAKMNQLISNGTVSGCPCGCRGDYELTEEGKAMLAAAPERTHYAQERHKDGG